MIASSSLISSALHIHTYKYIYTLLCNYNLPSLFVICVYVASGLTTLCWVKSEVVCLWDRLILFPSGIISCPQFPVQGVMAWDFLFPFRISMPVDIAMVPILFMQPYLWDCFTAHCMMFWVLQSFRPLFFDIPWTIDRGLRCTCTHQDWTHSLWCFLWSLYCI